MKRAATGRWVDADPETFYSQCLCPKGAVP
jgi:hypothetical protein